MNHKMLELEQIPNIIKFKKIKLDTLDTCTDISKKYPNCDIYSIMYKSDDLAVHGFIMQNKNVLKKVPVIIYCRGGNNLPRFDETGNSIKKYGELVVKSLLNKTELAILVNKGKAIVFASNYRGSSLSQGKDEFGGKDVDDLENLYPIIKQYKFSDHKKICIYGHSRGVMMALLVHRKVDWIKCLILVAGHIDNKEPRKEMNDMLKSKFLLSDQDIKDRHAINWINKLPTTVPILILHGSMDTKVDVSNAYLLDRELQKYNIPHKLKIFPDGGHSLIQYEFDVCVIIFKWIKQYLFKKE